MTPKINITIQVDAPAPEQFERYLATNGWTKLSPLSAKWNNWESATGEVSVPLMFGARGYNSSATGLISELAQLAGKTEFEVYKVIMTREESAE